MHFAQSGEWIVSDDDSRREVAFHSVDAAEEGAAIGGDRWLRPVLKAYGAHVIRTMQRNAQKRTWSQRPHLVRIVDAFLTGYEAALEARCERALVGRLSQVDAERRGFAFEGAAMAVTLLDLLTPWNRRRFFRLAVAAPEYVYLLHVGAGWAMARLRLVEGPAFRRFDLILRWLTIDGMGFHEGYFGGADLRRQSPLYRRLSACGAHVFDQGLGRSLWFTTDADPARIVEAISQTAAARHADLWSGVGLACAYAGGVDDRACETLREASGPFRASMAQGVAFAAEAHVRATRETPMHTERACTVMCGMTAAAAAAAARHAASGVAVEGVHAYEVWRTRLQSQLRTPFERSGAA